MLHLVLSELKFRQVRVHHRHGLFSYRDNSVPQMCDPHLRQQPAHAPCASRRLVTPHTRPSVTIRDQSELRESDVQEVQCTATATALYIQLCVYINIYTLLRPQSSLVINIRQTARVRTSTKDVNKLALQFRALELDWLLEVAVCTRLERARRRRRDRMRVRSADSDTGYCSHGPWYGT